MAPHPMLPSRLLRLLAALVVSTLLASACGGDDATVAGSGGSADDGGETSGEPEGDPALGDWVLVSGTLGGAPVEPISGYDATISFGADGSFGGRAACNGYGGTTSLDDGSIRLDEFAITEMACEPDVMALEAQFVEALLAVERYEVADGTLTLAGADVELVFEAVPPVPQSELVGTDWTLDTLIEGEVVSSTQGTPTLRLDEDGSMTGSTGCRTLTGRWVIAGGKLQFPELAADGECPPDLVHQDGFVVAVLGGPATVEIDGASLLLTSPGEIGLRYRSDLG